MILGSAGITTGIVGNAIGSSSRDIGTLCTHNNINKWSKHKPIRYNKVEGLSDEEFKGTSGDNSLGIYYGIKASTSAGNYNQLHDTNFDYIGKPNGGELSPFRLGDFRGYDTNAVPTLTGEITNLAYTNVPKSFNCSVIYDYTGSNTTGIDFRELINTDGDAIKFENYYPCILVGDYARGLFNEYNSQQTSIKFNNAWYNKFYADISSGNFPTSYINTKQTCTLFLTRNLYVEGGITDLRNWQYVKDKANAYNAFAVPNAVAKKVEIKNYRTYRILEAIKCIRESNGVKLTLYFPEGRPQTSTSYIIGIESPGSGSKKWEYSTSSIPVMSISFTWSELGILPIPNQTYTVSGSITNGGNLVSNFNFDNI